MFHAIYFEESLQNHPFKLDLCQKYTKIPHISCQRYGEVFNRKSQNFRLQKKHPALILAKKFNHFLLEAPKGYGIGGENNYYFSHMLNCIFDCRYCFLQGMYRSAHYVIFVNFEDFHQAIINKIASRPNEELYFFSGYDCDSLALEGVTQFAESFLPIFRENPKAILELRTKSTNIGFLLNGEPFPNCVVAYTITPKKICRSLEHKTPGFEKRIEALQQLQDKGWRIGLRFDPLIYCDDFQKCYAECFSEVFDRLSLPGIHSISLGPFRMPKKVFKNASSLYPEEKLFSHSLEERNGMVSYQKEKERDLVEFCYQELLKYAPESILFPCV